MNNSASANVSKMTDSELQDLVIESDSGARRPSGLSAKILFFTALAWSLFQLWVASPIPYSDAVLSYNEFVGKYLFDFLQIHPFNSTESRYIHLAFALFLAYMSYPAFKNSPRGYIPAIDWGFALISITCVLYLFFNKDALADRSGAPTNSDVIIAVVGMLMLLEAARRALGPPLVIIATIFLFYTFAGNAPFMPDLIAHKGQSIIKVASHQWLSSEGVFGIAIGVSTDFVFLFVLFGSLLEKAGAGNYFIKVAFSLLGHLKGGPAKAAVLASGMTGLISGSSIANVVTTGTFTVPLMRRVGFSREKAGAVEVAASVNGQIMPPVMGAAAFLMIEYVGIPYIEVVKAAVIPAVISYIALLYIVHLEALKADMKSLRKRRTSTFVQKIIAYAIIVTSLIIISGAVYYGIGWVKDVFKDNAKYIIAFGVTAVYLGLLYYASKFPPLEMDDPNSVMSKLPETGPTVKTGLYYILPIVVLVWCLMIEKLSPGLSAFWATFFMIIIVVTQRPISAFFRKSGEIKQGAIDGLIDLLDGLISGARNMTGIGIATAAAGIIVGVVSLTGVGQVLTELVERLAGGSFVLVLIYTAVICLILGMGLPTTANYIVVSSLMVPVVSELAKQNGIEIPLIAIHLFVFYFGIMADVTPPVGLASFAAAAVSGGDPIKTGVQAFVYSIRTVILPFIFIYNTDLLLIGVDSFLMGTIIFIKATIAMLVFAAATQGYFIIKSRLYESAILLLVAFAILRPGFWMDIITPPYEKRVVYQVDTAFNEAEAGQRIKIGVMGENNIGDPRPFSAFIDIKEEHKGLDRLREYGLVVRKEEGQVFVDDIVFNSQAEKDGFYFDYEITSLDVSQQQINRNWIYLVAMSVLFGVILMQRNRRSEIMSVDNN
ncbi:MAG: TRAP transporter permease [Rickettsiales bacterium]|nr:TRAP transporter permease [Pseudomonadota bacterium]MDA0966140.1 TRAP transporter permease [Pseudomonadota bacterium]MDG4543195.1 TRAP transporter permease [Rickettsiales bacterium]MDG4545393.1 TRAP transporter permease [Rickettsiales bacterium]MDG4547842.1 TRAP transporter permease [Rickettsiales bacterium]